MSASPLAPSLLIAMPQLADPNFHRAVVLLIHHDEEGTFGVVLNRPTELTAPSLCSTLEIAWNGNPEENIDWGGPVQPETGWVLFGGGRPQKVVGEVQDVTEGVSFAGSLDVLRHVAENPPPHVKLLLGYAGWGPGQLEWELSEGAWLVAPASREAVFELDSDSMWDGVVRSLGIDPATLVAARGVH